MFCEIQGRMVARYSEERKGNQINTVLPEILLKKFYKNILHNFFFNTNSFLLALFIFF